MKNKKLKDGLGAGGKGRLTDAFMDKLQNLLWSRYSKQHWKLDRNGKFNMGYILSQYQGRK